MIKITASNREEAVKEALLLFTEKGERVTPDDLLIEEVGTTGGFLGLGKKKVFQISIKREEEQREEEKREEEKREREKPQEKEKQEKEVKREIIEEGDEASDSSPPIDGSFKISIKNQGVMLKVFPPESGGDAITIGQVKEDLKRKKVVDIEEELLQDTVMEASSKWVAIAPRKRELDRDAQLSFRIRKKGREAYVDYLPPLGGKNLTKISISQALKEAGITHGVERALLESLIGKRKKTQGLLIARGDEPTPGKDAYLKYHYTREKKSFGVEREDGSIDFRSLDNIVNALPGDTLVSKVPPKPGRPGKTVTGEEIPPPKPKDIRLPKGKNVEISQDGLQLRAAIEGQVVETGNVVNVFAVYTVNGDVNMEVGNIDFIGNVNVHGDVHEGFSIKARGDVFVKGGVNAASIDSGGSIQIGKGFQGRKKGILKAKGDIRALFVENGKVMAQGDVIIGRAVMHSIIQAGGNLQVLGKGLLVGGSAMTGKMVEATTLGSSLATPTEIQVGVGPQTREKIMTIEEQMEELQENLKKTEKAIAFLLQKKKDEGRLPEDKESLLKRMVDTRKYLKTRIAEFEQEYQILGESLMNLQGGKIKVKGKIYTGVTLSIGSAQRRIRDQMSHTTFVFHEGEVISTSY